MVEQKQKERKFLEQLLDGTKVENYTIPVPIKAELRKYQQVRKRFSSILMYIGKKIKSSQWMENRTTINAGESYNHGLKSCETFAFMELFFSSYIKNTSLTPQTYVGRVCRDFFFRVSTLCRVGGWETSRKFRKRCTISWGNREITKKECHSAVLRIFV